MNVWRFGTWGMALRLRAGRLSLELEPGVCGASRSLWIQSRGDARWALGQT